MQQLELLELERRASEHFSSGRKRYLDPSRAGKQHAVEHAVIAEPGWRVARDPRFEAPARAGTDQLECGAEEWVRAANLGRGLLTWTQVGEPGLPVHEGIHRCEHSPGGLG